MTASRSQFDASVNYYQVLDVAPGATPEDITRAYRRLMRLTHPDFFQEPLERAKAEERTKLINAAYTVLSRPDVRKAYDNQRRSTAISDALMQRYTGGAPGRADPLARQPRVASPATVRQQQRAYRAAVRQVMVMTAAFVIALMILILAFPLVGVALEQVWSGLSILVG